MYTGGGAQGDHFCGSSHNYTGFFSFSLGPISASNTKKTSSSGTKSLELINASVAKLLQDVRPMFATYLVEHGSKNDQNTVFSTCSTHNIHSIGELTNN